MKKNFSILFILIIIIIIIKCDDINNCLEKKSVGNKNDCQNINLNDMKCCYVYFKLAETEFKFCTPIKYSMDDIKSYKKKLNEAKNIEILCNGNLIKYSYYFIVFLILILI
jgi:hypothetical protein